MSQEKTRDLLKKLKIIDPFIQYLTPLDRKDVRERLLLLIENERRAAAEAMRERITKWLEDDAKKWEEGEKLTSGTTRARFDLYARYNDRVIDEIEALPLDERNG